MPNLTESKFNGATLRALREYWGYTQQSLAVTIGVNVTTVLRWEHGVNIPSDIHISQLANALKCSVDDFTQEFLEKFRSHSESTLRAMFTKSANSESISERKLALAIHRTLYPDPIPEELGEVTNSEAEDQDADLLEEGDAPDYYDE